MSLKKSITNPAVIVSVLSALCVLVLFIYWLSPEHDPKTLKEAYKITAEEQAIREQNAAYDEMIRRFSKAKTEAKLKESKVKVVEESSTTDEVNATPEKRRLEVVHEDDFSKDVVLPNGQVTPILKSNILGDSEEIETRFKFEKRDERWAGNGRIL